MFNFDLFKAANTYFGPEAGGKSPEPQKKGPELNKDNPNDLSKPVNREKLYKQADQLIRKLNQGDAKSKTQAESLKKVLDIARNTENDKLAQEIIKPQKTAEILKTQLDSILRPEQGMVFSPDKLTAKPNPKDRKAALNEAKTFGMIGLLTPSPDVAPSRTLFDQKASQLKGDGNKSYEGELAAALKQPSKTEVGPVVITASPTKEPPKPYRILAVSLNSIPMNARNDAKNVAANSIDKSVRYYAATDGKTYRAEIGSPIDGQSVIKWNRIEKQV